MISLEQLQKRIMAVTPYKVEFTQETELDLQAIGKIFVSYATMRNSTVQEDFETTIFKGAGENLVQTFDIQMITTNMFFPNMWKSLYAALLGWNPVEEDVYSTGFTYLQGGVRGLSNGTLWWLDRWSIGFPTLHVDFQIPINLINENP